jgi:hypothetical protein
LPTPYKTHSNFSDGAGGIARKVQYVTSWNRTNNGDSAKRAKKRRLDEKEEMDRIKKQNAHLQRHPGDATIAVCSVQAGDEELGFLGE